MSTTDKLRLGVEKQYPLCKGHVYSYLKNTYISSRGEIVDKTVFRKLKKLSCDGCPQCGGLLDMLVDEVSEYGMIPYPLHLNHGETVSLIAVNDGRCFSDTYDEYHLEFALWTKGTKA